MRLRSLNPFDPYSPLNPFNPDSPFYPFNPFRPRTKFRPVNPIPRAVQGLRPVIQGIRPRTYIVTIPCNPRPVRDTFATFNNGWRGNYQASSPAYRRQYSTFVSPMQYQYRAPNLARGGYSNYGRPRLRATHTFTRSHSFPSYSYNLFEPNFLFNPFNLTFPDSNMTFPSFPFYC